MKSPIRFRSRPQRRRAGITAVLAMLYMILFSTLALGFYATVTTSVQLSKNDRKASKALQAAESGIQFMRYKLARVNIPANTPKDQLITQLYLDLKAMEGTGNLPSSGTVSMSGNTISIPGQSGRCIVTDPTDNSGFTVSLTDTSGGQGEIVCKIIGYTNGMSSGSNQKAVRLDFTRQPISSSIFDNAVAAKGKVVVQKGGLLGVTGISADTIANAMSAKGSSPAFVMTGGTIGGNVGVLSKPWASITGGSVHGSSNLATINANYVQAVSAPEFPTIDTTVYKAYATNTYSSAGKDKTLTNIRIPANSGTIKFTGNTVIQGILYVESPNTVEFGGNTEMQGIIVFENAGTTATNVLNMSGNFSVGNLPTGSAFDPLRTITGLGVIAPTTALYMTGSADSQFRGNLIIGTFRNGGSADLVLDKGSIIAMDASVDSVVLNGKNVRFTATGKNNQPNVGVTYSTKFVPSQGSYLELD